MKPCAQETFLRDPMGCTKLSEEFVQLCEDRKQLRETIVKCGDDHVQLPVNLARLNSNARSRFGRVGPDTRSDLDPATIVRAVQDLCTKLLVVRGCDAISREAQVNTTLLFQCLLRSTLASKRVLVKHRIGAEAFQWLVGEIETRFAKAVVHPGEMVGAIAAQSIGTCVLGFSRLGLIGLCLCRRAGDADDTEHVSPGGSVAE